MLPVTSMRMRGSPFIAVTGGESERRDAAAKFPAGRPDPCWTRRPPAATPSPVADGLRGPALARLPASPPRPRPAARPGSRRRGAIEGGPRRTGFRASGPAALQGMGEALAGRADRLRTSSTSPPAPSRASDQVSAGARPEVSGSAMSTPGRTARDVPPGLTRTCRKLGASIVPPPPNLVRQAAPAQAPRNPSRLRSRPPPFRLDAAFPEQASRVHGQRSRASGGRTA